MDLVFVIDTTGSLQNAIDGVVRSVDAFVDGLAQAGVDARIGGIAFGDQVPLATCTAPDAPLIDLTEKFGPASDGDPDSFGAWLGHLSAGHCGDNGGDRPENALDAIQYVLGAASPDWVEPGFSFSAGSLKVFVVITDVVQHQRSDRSGIARFDLVDVVAAVQGQAVVHVVGPLVGCEGTLYEGSCACDMTAGICDEGCTCDPACATPGCPEDVTIGFCDEGVACDIDCAGFPGDVTCDTRVGWCDAAIEDPATACRGDVDCAGGLRPGAGRGARRCQEPNLGGYANVGELTTATGGAFTVLSPNGDVDLTSLPLTGVLRDTKNCDLSFPDNADALRCVFIDGDRQGEITVRLD